MRVDVVRIIADWMADDENGVNAILPNVPQDAGDVEVPIVTIVDETRHSWVARRNATRAIAESGFYLALFLFEQIDYEGKNSEDAATWQDAEIAIGIRYVCKEMDSALANTFAGRSFRAARACLLALNRSENHAARSRNGVRLEEIVSLHEIDVNEQLGDAICTGGMVARCNAIDLMLDPTT